ncbi:MAG: carbohydrate-binding domain-containing protein [Bacteroidales bacterium]|nr:carbohydrate-binding domain-containing protein [Bacteroidales bacterium]
MKTIRMPVMLVAAAIAAVSCDPFGTDGDDPFSIADPFQQGGMGGAQISVTPADCPINTSIEEYAGQTADDISSDAVGENEDLYWELIDVKAKNTISIVFNGDSVEITNPNETDNTVEADGAHVIITLGKKSRINLSGSSADGSVRIYPKDAADASKFILSLNNLSLSSKTGPAINSQVKKRVYIHLEGENTLSDASAYTDDVEGEDSKGCLFSEGNQIWSGSGKLTITGNRKHAIATDGYFYMRPGPTIVVLDAASNGIKVKGDSDQDEFGLEYGMYIAGGLIWAHNSATAGKCLSTDANFRMTGGKLILDTTGDAEWDHDEQDTSSPACIKADGHIIIHDGEIVAKSSGKGGKGMNADSTITFKGGVVTAAISGGQFVYGQEDSDPKAIKAEGDILIEGGEIKACSTGRTDGSEGIESKSSITISGGDTYVYAYDDAVNSGVDFNMSGGKLYAYALNNDAIDSNSNIRITGGEAIAISCSREAAFDNDNPGSQNVFAIDGGTVWGLSGTTYSPSASSKQRAFVIGGVSAESGKTLAVKDASGNTLGSIKLPSALSGYGVVFSAPGITQGTTYKLMSDSSELYSFTCSGQVTSAGSSTGMGGPGGGPGGGFGRP